jgi:hypothetical protein
MRYVRSRVIWCLLLLPFWGCRQAEPDTVTGKVTIDGEVVEGILVTYAPTDSTVRVACGRTDSKGVYNLLSGVQGKPIVFPGKYKIVLFDEETMGSDTQPSYTIQTDVGANGERFSATPVFEAGRVPPEYTSADTSPKEVEVLPGQNIVNLDF